MYGVIDTNLSLTSDSKFEDMPKLQRQNRWDDQFGSPRTAIKVRIAISQLSKWKKLP